MLLISFINLEVNANECMQKLREFFACIEMIIQVKTQKEEADQRFGRLPPIYTVGPLTPITEVSAELYSPVTTSISDFDMDLPGESDYELVLFMIIRSHACE